MAFHWNAMHALAKKIPTVAILYALLFVAVMSGTAYAVASTAVSAIVASFARPEPAERIAAGSFAPLPLAPSGRPPSAEHERALAKCARVAEVPRRACLAKARAQRWRHRHDPAPQ